MGTGTGTGAVCSLITLVEICFVLFSFLLGFSSFSSVSFFFLLHYIRFCFVLL